MTKEQYRECLNNLVKNIRDDYDFPEKIAGMIVSRSDSDHHSSCMEEVRDSAYDLAEFIQDVFNLAKESK